MDAGFVKTESTNLPRIDAFMVGEFIALNSEICSAEQRNDKASIINNRTEPAFILLKNGLQYSSQERQIFAFLLATGSKWLTSKVTTKKFQKLRSVRRHSMLQAQVLQFFPYNFVTPQ
ncbi:hypothetical protein evm_000640 [Chilo suppressalis]|nr:hypothetical protein evm_000640 [Chilo suppressalis]